MYVYIYYIYQKTSGKPTKFLPNFVLFLLPDLLLS